MKLFALGLVTFLHRSLVFAQFTNVTVPGTPTTSGSVLITPNATIPDQSGSPVADPSAFATPFEITVDQLWDLFVGPVDVASTTTTVAATPVPSNELIPPPPLFFSPFPTGEQVPLTTKNESWKFPSGFAWGVSSASYQIEGAVKDEGRGPSVWDVFLHRIPGYSIANQTGDITDNGYYLYKQDIARIAALGVPYYSFSISWSRVMPFGRGQINELALEHYDDVIKTCLEFNVQPIVTLFHWDLPLYLQNLYGGWLSPQIIPDYVAYAEVIFKRYANSGIQHWFTFNEPIEICVEYPYPSNYFTAVDIPAKGSVQPYFCGHNLILAHAQAYHLAKSLGINGTISIKNNGGYKIPLTNSTEDALAVQRAWDFNEGWFATPLFLTGQYPESVREYVATLGLVFSEEEQAMINGTADLFAHDAYTSNFFSAPDVGIDACLANSSNPLFPSCTNSTSAYSAADGGWGIGPASTSAAWLTKATEWVPILLAYIQDTWKPRQGIVVSEFGWAEPFEQLKTIKTDITFDLGRTVYYHDYMESILIALSEGTNVVGCLAWSIVDNLEWTSGFETKFGMQYVNFSSPGRERSYKASFFEYVNAFKLYAEDPVVPTFVSS